MIELKRIQKAILEEDLEGWLFYIFHHRDKLACSMLDIPESKANTRPWIYFIPAKGGAIKIVHAIEACGLEHLPGETAEYSSQKELLMLLGKLASRKNIAVQSSESLSAISFLDHGTALVLEKAGFVLHSSAPLVQRFFSTLDEKALESHTRSCEILLKIVKKAWSEISKAFAAKRPVYEGEIRDLMLAELKKKKLVTDHPPIVAAGTSSARPHYEPRGKGKKIAAGKIVQFDIWAKEKQEDAVYADISWIGFTARSADEVPPVIRVMFTDLILVRDSIVNFIGSAVSSGKSISGEDADKHARTRLTELGLGELIKHRTGHSIDREVHGSGVNLDSVEFPDTRKFIEGCCFSVEPGIYSSEYGMRTEIDVYIKKKAAHVTGSEIQTDLLLLG
jgi:Xaa-Pro dipeptidase